MKKYEVISECGICNAACIQQEIVNHANADKGASLHSVGIKSLIQLACKSCKATTFQLVVQCRLVENVKPKVDKCSECDVIKVTLGHCGTSTCSDSGSSKKRLLCKDCHSKHVLEAHSIFLRTFI